MPLKIVWTEGEVTGKCTLEQGWCLIGWLEMFQKRTGFKRKGWRKNREGGVKMNIHHHINSLSWCIEEIGIQIHLPHQNLHFPCLGPALLFSTNCKKIRLFATPTFFTLKTNTSIYSNYNKISFLKTNSHEKLPKTQMYITLLVVHDLFKNVLEYM